MDDESRLGLPRGTVRLAEHQAAWARLFEAEAMRLRAVIADARLAPLRFEHSGSTAVPGLVAKPIIDFVAGYAPGADVQAYVAALQRAGYEPRGPQGEMERELLVLGDASHRTHHLSLAPIDGTFWRQHLAFRDLLRADPELRAAYAALKRRLAAAHEGDRRSYPEGKSAFIEGVISR